MSTEARSDATTPLVVSTVLVPLSRSSASEAALAPAARVAEHFGADLRVLTVGIEQAEADAMAERVSALAAGRNATVDTWVDWDVSGSIVDASREYTFPLVCMASHARGRLGEMALGSFTTPVLAAASDPVLVVGPELEPSRRMKDGPVVACVDGSPTSERVIPDAARWAASLGVPLCIVTVAEPALAGLDDREAYRAHGPKGDPRAYVERLADEWRRPDLDVSGQAIFDPVGPAQALADEFETSRCGLLAVTTHARAGIRRAVFGSQAAAIIRHSPVPVLVVPSHSAER